MTVSYRCASIGLLDSSSHGAINVYLQLFCRSSCGADFRLHRVILQSTRLVIVHSFHCSGAIYSGRTTSGKLGNLDKLGNSKTVWKRRRDSKLSGIKPATPTPYGTGGICSHFYNWLDTGRTVSKRTANKKLTKLY